MTKINGFQYFSGRIMTSMAGRLAEDLCEAPDNNGWRRTRNEFEKLVFHESGHALVSWVHGTRPFQIEVREGIGRVSYSEESADLSRDYPSDDENIGDRANLLTICGKSPDLKLLENETRDLLRRLWPQVRRIAQALIFKGKLNANEIAALLSDMPTEA